MLQSLRIRNLALLDEVALDFEEGFTAVTGETGAGKSILLGGLSLLAGERADKTVIRQGAASCEAEASLYFAKPARIDAVLEELGLPPCEEGVLILKRSLSRDKPPKVSVNGSLATLASLQRLGELWVDFHGPNEPRRLLKESCQLELLDLFGRCGEALASYGEGYRAWREARAERDRILAEERLSSDQVDFLKGQLAAMDSLDLSAEAVEGLERDFQRMSRSQDLLELAQALERGLSGDEDPVAGSGVRARLAALLREAHRLAEIDPASRGLAERLSAAAVEIADLGSEFGSLASQLQFDPAQADALTARMNAWLDLKRKYGGDPASVLASREALRRRLAVQGDLDGEIARLEGKIAEAEKAARKLAKALRLLREKAAGQLAKAASGHIARLGFQRADFRVGIVPKDELGPSGDCGCEFLFSPNVGEAPLPLNRVASSGELARVMLALKTVLADMDQVPLLVFDEVDANVGGEVGSAVGERMAAIARAHQVLCVTHLPQVAARATCHLVVAKDQSGERAVVTISPIQASRRARVSELARMLGDRSAKSALAHAEELLGRGGP